MAKCTYRKAVRVSLTGDRGSVLKILYLVGKTNKQNDTASLILLYGIFQKISCLCMFQQTMMKNLKLSTFTFDAVGVHINTSLAHL